METHPARGPYRSRTELWQQRFFVVVGDRADNVDESGYAAEPKLFGQLGAELVERDGFVGIVRLDELCSDRRGDAEENLGLRGSLWGVSGGQERGWARTYRRA